jgi:hypothetical protein
MDRDSLPRVIRLHYPELSLRVWSMWRADEKRHLPSAYLKEPPLLFDDVMQLENAFTALVNVLCPEPE